MTFTGIETELTSAATDLLLALLCLAGILAIGRSELRRQEPQRALVWIWAFGFLGAAGVLGAAVHGLELGPGRERLIWQPLYLALGWTVSLFAAGVLIDLRGSALDRRLIAGLLAAGGLFYGTTLVFPGTFIVFLLYEAAALIFALGAYLALAVRDRERYSLWMAAGVGASLAAAGLQAAGVSLRVIWEFDRNGVFHLVQAVGVVLLIRGVLAPRVRLSPAPGPAVR